MNIRPTAHDITFDFKDSCNCCGTRRNPTDQVYVTRRGVVERFRIDKAANIDEAIRHAVENVQNHLDAICEYQGVDPSVVLEKLVEEGIDLKKPAPLTTEMVFRINRVVSQTFESHPNPTAGGSAIGRV